MCSKQIFLVFRATYAKQNKYWIKSLVFIPSHPSQQCCRGYSHAAFRVWLGGWVHPSVRCALPCGHDTDYSFCPITFKLHMYVVYDKRRKPINFGSWGERSTLTLCLWNLLGKIQTTVFALSLADYTCQLLMMRGGTLLFWVMTKWGQRSRSTLALYVLNLVGTIQTTFLFQSLSNFTCQLLMMTGGSLLILGRGVKGQGRLALCV